MIAPKYIFFLLYLISVSTVAQGRLWNRGTIQLDTGTEARVHGNIILDSPITGSGYLVYAGSNVAWAAGDNLKTDYFRMESSAPLQLKNDLIIVQQADFISGVLDASEHGVTFQNHNPTTGGNAASYIHTSFTGYVRFPVNTQTASIPMGVNNHLIYASFVQAATADTFTIQLWPVLTDDGLITGNSINHHVGLWALNIQEALAGQNDITLTLQCPDASLAVDFFEHQSVLIQYDGNSYIPLSLCGTDISNDNPNIFQVSSLQNLGLMGVGDSLFLPLQPEASITVVGSTTLCLGDSVLLISSPSDAYLWNNGVSDSSIYVSSSGNYQVTVTNTNGCQSISTPVLITFFPIDSVIQYQTSCNAYEWSATGQTYQTSGIYIASLQNQHGCDSIITLQLTLLFSDSLHQNFSICPGSSVTVGSNTYDTDGIYTDIFTGVHGCDSIVITTVEVLGCSGILSFNESEFTVYPNPAYEQITVFTSFYSPDVFFSIKDLHGRIVLSGNYSFHDNSPTWIDIKELSSGVYFLHIHNKVTRFIKK